MITAHGGAMNTGRNSYKYFSEIVKYRVDAIEVDVHKRGETLYLSHIFPKLFLKNAIKLEFVFEFCKRNNMKVNCDLKRKNMVKDVVALAKKMDATQYLIFTGYVMPGDIPELTAGEAYLNDSFFVGKYDINIENLGKIKTYVDSFKNPHIAGINLSYRYCSNEFIAKAKELGLPLSIYTVDDKSVLERIMPQNVKNVTTNRVDLALALKN